MGIRRPHYRLLIFYSLPLHIIAFRSRHEVLKGGYGSISSRNAITDYYDDRDRERERESARHITSGGRYSFYSDEAYIHSDLDYFQENLFAAVNILADPNIFGIDNPFDTLLPASITSNGFDPCNGDDCEECTIPDEFKHVENPIDTLMYLGIQRAKPIVTAMVDD